MRGVEGAHAPVYRAPLADLGCMQLLMSLTATHPRWAVLVMYATGWECKRSRRHLEAHEGAIGIGPRPKETHHTRLAKAGFKLKLLTGTLGCGAAATVSGLLMGA